MYCEDKIAKPLKIFLEEKNRLEEKSPFWSRLGKRTYSDSCFNRTIVGR